MSTAETALIVAVPETEPAVGSLRAQLDTAAAWGVPAHITVLYPFLPPAQITSEVLAGLSAVIGAHPRIDTVFRQVRWFATDVVWLAPEPDEPFRALTNAIWQRFPQCAPYGGAHDDVIPHLTVGHSAPQPDLAAAAAQVTAALPIEAAVSAVRLISGTADAGSWHTLCEFPLAFAQPGAVKQAK